MGYKPKSKFSKPRQGSKDYMSDPQYEGVLKGPTPEGDVQDGLAIKALRDLPKSSYSIQADPYSSALPGSEPYPPLARFNKTVGGSYGGMRNIDGGNAQQYANSVRSKMLAFFDFFRLKLDLNYRYRPMKLNKMPTTTGPDNHYVGYALVDQCRQSISEAVSVLNATTFTQMAINNYVIETDMPLGSAVRKEITVTENGKQLKKFVYFKLTDVIYASLTYYQLVLQEILQFINWHNSFRLKMGTAIRSSWNRETPNLNSLFGMFKKKSFTALFDSLCLGLPGEFVDVTWAKQVNMLSLMPSRRSNAFTDPVKELQVRHVHPTFRMYLAVATSSGTTYERVFDSETDLARDLYAGNLGVLTSMFDAIDQAEDYLSIEHVMEWARAADPLNINDNAYFNYVNNRISAVQSCFTKFKEAFADVRETLEVVSRTGLVTWQKGFRPSVTKDTDAQLFDNMIVDHVYQVVMSGAPSVTINTDTKRWKTYTLWNMYSGIPAFDVMSGGCFITFSGKNIVTSTKVGEQTVDLDPDHVSDYLPIMFYAQKAPSDMAHSTATLYAVSRDGYCVDIDNTEVKMSTSDTLNRLVPLASQDGLMVKLPVMPDKMHKFGGSDENLDTKHASTIQKTLLDSFQVAADALDQFVNPDLIAVYEIEIEDITNESVAYARLTGPFKGSVAYQSKLGFDTFGVGRQVQ